METTPETKDDDKPGGAMASPLQHAGTGDLVESAESYGSEGGAEQDLTVFTTTSGRTNGLASPVDSIVPGSEESRIDESDLDMPDIDDSEDDDAESEEAASSPATPGRKKPKHKPMNAEQQKTQLEMLGKKLMEFQGPEQISPQRTTPRSDKKRAFKEVEVEKKAKSVKKVKKVDFQSAVDIIAEDLTGVEANAEDDLIPIPKRKVRRLSFASD